MRWILIISFFLGLIPQFRASVVNPDERHQDSYSSIVGFFGQDVTLEDCSDTKHSKLKSRFFRIHITNNSSRSSQNYIIRDFLQTPFSKFSLFVVRKTDYKSFLRLRKDINLYKLFNNYRI
jgi:hypothetical protein